jgi:uncharacterized membrane protein YeaQ/YmgE (transglycosylase-associated protein family)
MNMSDQEKSVESVDHLDNPYSGADIKPTPLRKVKAKAVDLQKLALKTLKLMFRRPSAFRRILGTLKRTVTGRNKAGKILTHVVVGAASIAVGARLQPILNLFHTTQPQPLIPNIMDFNLLTLILMIVGTALGYAAKHLKSKGEQQSWAGEIIVDVKDIVGQMREARSPESDQGRTVTPSEREAVIQVAETKALELSKRLLRQFFGGEETSDGKRPQRDRQK